MCELLSVRFINNQCPLFLHVFLMLIRNTRMLKSPPQPQHLAILVQLYILRLSRSSNSHANKGLSSRFSRIHKIANSDY